MLLTQEGHTDAVIKLLQCGADVLLRDKKHRTGMYLELLYIISLLIFLALDLAKVGGHKEVYGALENTT